MECGHAQTNPSLNEEGEGVYEQHRRPSHPSPKHILEDAVMSKPQGYPCNGNYDGDDQPAHSRPYIPDEGEHQRTTHILKIVGIEVAYIRSYHSGGAVARG